ncbi:MAG: hypothetical protein KDD61_07865 [Bdellovibrionales bacterium]|nr:hypothetical protein [Bdellovibrionales bacterium]
MIQKIAILIIVMTFAQLSFAGKVKFRKTQEVNFDEASIDGKVRTPDGAFINQKRGVKFLPLYKIKKQFDRGIRSSVEYLR